MTALHAKARSYVKAGWWIFPCHPLSKRPATENGFHDASNDLAQIDKWWTENPEYNIGLDCGRSAIVVVDVDVKDGKQGAESFVALIDENFDVLATPTALTRSGGRHYFYAGNLDRKINAFKNVGLPDIDLCGAKGYVLLAPSVVREDGKTGTYRWTHETEKPPRERPDFLPLPDLFLPREKETAVSWEPLKAEAVSLTAPLTPGERNAELYRRACLLRRYGWQEKDILAALKTMNAQSTVALPERELTPIARSASKHKPDHRVTAPPAPPEGGYKLLTAEELRERISDRVDWIVEDLIRQSGLCLLSARPGAGKSTLMRTLATCVSTGAPFLSRRCKQGKVIWIGMEESDQDLDEALEDMGMGSSKDILYATRAEVPDEHRHAWLDAIIGQYQPSLVIIDTFGAFFPEIENINDYSNTSKAIDPLLALRAKHDTSLVVLHHTKRSADEFLGSQKILASFDVSMVMTVSPQGSRTIKTDKMRSGVPIEDTILAFDSETRQMTAVEPKWVADKRICEQNMLAYLKPGMAVSARDLANHSGRKGGISRSAIASLLCDGLIAVSGSGKRGDPKTYTCSGSTREKRFLGTLGTQIPHTLTHRECVVESEESAESEDPHETYVRMVPRDSQASPGNPQETPGKSQETKSPSLVALSRNGHVDARRVDALVGILDGPCLDGEVP